MTEITRDTRLSDLVAEYPWIKEELFRISDRFRMMDSAAGRLLLRRVTVAELSRRSGMSEEALIGKLTSFLRTHK